MNSSTNTVIAKMLKLCDSYRVKPILRLLLSDAIPLK